MPVFQPSRICDSMRLLGSALLPGTALLLSLALAACSGSDKTSDSADAQGQPEIAGVWETTTGSTVIAYSFYPNNIFIRQVFASGQSYDPLAGLYDRIVEGNGIPGTFQLAANALTLTYAEDGFVQQKAIEFYDASQVMIGDALFEKIYELTDTPSLPDPLDNVALQVAYDDNEPFAWPVVATHGVIEEENFVGLTLDFQSYGGTTITVSIGDVAPISLNQPLAFDGRSWWEGANLDAYPRDGSFTMSAENANGSITFTQWNQSGAVVTLSGSIQSTVLPASYSSSGFDEIVIAGTFENVNVSVELATPASPSRRPASTRRRGTG